MLNAPAYLLMVSMEAGHELGLYRDIGKMEKMEGNIFIGTILYLDYSPLFPASQEYL